MNISTMSISQWTRLLVEDNLTMYTNDDNSREFIPCKAENNSPLTDWDQTWHLARMKGLGSSNTAFLWKLLHLLLPTKENIHRKDPNTSPICNLCKENVIEDMNHCFFTCNFNDGAGLALINVLRVFLPFITMSKVLRLEYDVGDDLEFPCVWLSSAILLAIWDKRTSVTKIKTYEIRAEIEGKISLLRRTRYSNQADRLSLLCDNFK